MYESIDDPYCYSGTTVLKNKLGIRDQARLEEFETDMTRERSAEAFPSGKLDHRHYRAIHKHLFQDVYSWAGKIRTVRISKSGSMFCYPESIDREMQKLFGSLAAAKFFKGTNSKEFATQAAHFLAELNAIHPFREGNGRTQLAFLTMLAEQAAHPLDLDKMNPKEIMDAMIASFVGNEGKLAHLLMQLVDKK